MQKAGTSLTTFATSIGLAGLLIAMATVRLQAQQAAHAHADAGGLRDPLRGRTAGQPRLAHGDRDAGPREIGERRDALGPAVDGEVVDAGLVEDGADQCRRLGGRGHQLGVAGGVLLDGLPDRVAHPGIGLGGQRRGDARRGRYPGGFRGMSG